MSGTRHAKNVVLNLVGLGLPAIVAVVAVPILVRELGVERMGVLTLAWALIGYFGIFDLGLGRALTKAVAERVDTPERGEIPRLVWSAMGIMTLLGIAAGAAIAILTPWLTHSVLHVPAPLADETRIAFYLLALTTPLTIVTAGLRGVLEGTQRFDLVNAVRVPMGILTYVGPLLVLPFSQSIAAVVGALALTRLVATLIHTWLCIRVIPGLGSMSFDKGAVPPLLRTGGWMTVSNVALPLMVTIDRFVIGALISLAAVAYYATPYEAVTKLWIIPAAITAVIFPALARTYRDGVQPALKTFDSALRFTVIMVFPAVLILVLFAKDILGIWIGADFAQHAARPMQWLAVGVFFSCIDSVAYSALQAFGRADITGKAQLGLLPVHIGLVFVAVWAWGIEGAAAVWALRMIVETGFLLFLLRVPSRGEFRVSSTWPVWALGLFLATLVVVPEVALAPRLAAAGLLLAGFGILAWTRLIHVHERNRLYKAIARYAPMPFGRADPP